MHDHKRHLNDHELLLATARELSPRRQAESDAHLVGCIECRVRGLVLQQGSELWPGAHLSDPIAPARVDQSRAQLRARLSELARREPRPPEARLAASLHPSQWAMIAAAVVAAVLLVRVVPRLQSSAGVTAAVERDALPIAKLTPGASWNVTVAELCRPGTREYREVPAAVRQQVLRVYGMEAVASGEYELDYLITPELGGAPDAQNLWPQRYASRVWNAHVKDQLERLLPQVVCEGKLSLRTAQRDIASDWVAAYKKYFRSDVPLQMLATLNTGGEEWPDDGAITYPVWRTNQPALELISFAAAR